MRFQALIFTMLLVFLLQVAVYSSQVRTAGKTRSLGSSSSSTTTVSAITYDYLASSHTTHWPYGQCPLNTAAKTYNDVEQSPIDIITQVKKGNRYDVAAGAPWNPVKTTVLSAYLTSITGTKVTGQGSVEIYTSDIIVSQENDGHTLKFTPLTSPTKEHQFLHARLMDLNGKYYNYESTELHFHAPSEHTVDNKQFPLELHIVMTNQDYITGSTTMK